MVIIRSVEICKNGPTAESFSSFALLHLMLFLIIPNLKKFKDGEIVYVKNLTIDPLIGCEDWDPDVITRMIIIAPGAHVSESEIVNELHMLDLPLTIKYYCGSMVSGKTKDFEAIQ